MSSTQGFEHGHINSSGADYHLEELSSGPTGLVPLESASSRTTLQPSIFGSLAEPPASSVVSDGLPSDDADRTVNRKLRGIHVFMITVSGVLGVGLYVRSGTILHIGGPAAVIIAFSAMGFLAWTVMQCIGEMLALWPVSGALTEYVSTFVDRELGTAVGVTYWFTFSMNFAADIVAAAGVIEYWNPGKPVIGTVMFFLVPLFLILFNSFGVQIYGLIEVIAGTLKLAGAIVVIIAMIIINVGVGSEGYIGIENYKDNIFQYDHKTGDNWVIVFFISCSIAIFSFTGVEAATVPAFESRFDSNTQPENVEKEITKSPWDRISVQFSATWTTFIVWIIYIFAALMLTFNIKWDNPGLPGVSWLGSLASTNATTKSDSGFVLSAARSQINGLADLFSAILLFTAISAANTNIYVASRTIFGLTRELDGDRWKLLAFFGRTNSYRVPVRAMFLSCLFIWVPFLYLSPNNSPGTTISSLLEVLSQMSSVGCLIVWLCKVWAFIRFYNCVKIHQNELEDDPFFAHVCRFRRGRKSDMYPWRSHGQPLTMYAALFGCLFVLIVADGASLWNGFHRTAFLSAYLAPMCFIVFWLCLKVYRFQKWSNIQWRLEDISNLKEVKEKIRSLDQIKQRATTTQQPIGWANLWGLM